MTLNFLSHEASKVQTLVIHLSSDGKGGSLETDIVLIPSLNGKNFDNQITLGGQITEGIDQSCAGSFYLQNRFQILDKINSFKNPKIADEAKKTVKGS